MRILYIRMPKCGSSSIVDYVSSHFKNIEITGGANEGYWHSSNKGYINFNSNRPIYKSLDLNKFDFSFSSIRNPWARVVSAYHKGGWNGESQRAEYPTFISCVNAIREDSISCPASKWHVTPLCRHLVRDGELIVNHLIRIENIQEDFDKICDKIGIPHQQLPHKNKSKHKHYTEYYDDETRQIVAEKYARDIEYFGYEFGD